MVEKSIDTLNKRGVTIWLTGLSGAGKTTLADRLVEVLTQRGRPPEVLDGDVVRTHLSKGLGFSKEDRDTNIRRIAFVSRLVTRQGGVVVVAAISPYRDTRDEARVTIEEAGGFVEVYVKCPIEELVRRDVKGLYAKALSGEIGNFTGISDPYEEPLAPEVTVETDRESVDESVAKLVSYLEAHGYLVPAAQTDGPEARGAKHTLNGDAAHEGRVEPVPDVLTAAARPALYGRLGAPHGGVLVEARAWADEARAWRERIGRGDVKRLAITAREACDLELLGNGALSPLTGFLGLADYRSVVHDLRLANGTLWSLPVVLGTSEAQAAQLREGEPVALVAPDGAEPLAILHLREKVLLTQADIQAEAEEVYRTTEEAHPGVRALYARGPVLLAGEVTVLGEDLTPYPSPFWTPLTPNAAPNGRGETLKQAAEGYRLDPSATRQEFARRGWRTVVGFQTRNPIHRAHEYLLKTALESVDGLLLHPLVGETKEDDIPADVRLRCYEALLAGYFPAERVLLATLPAAMRYAGPREAIFHALIRKNYGCTHFIVGRDHAGVGNYYGTYDAQRIFEQFSEEELGIRPVFFEHTLYCTACAGTVSSKTCAHTPDQHIALSGTKVRSLLAEGHSLPPEFSRPEVAQILLAAATQTVPA